MTVVLSFTWLRSINFSSSKSFFRVEDNGFYLLGGDYSVVKVITSQASMNRPMTGFTPFRYDVIDSKRRGIKG